MGLPVIGSLSVFQPVHAAHHLVYGAESHLSHDLAKLLRNEEEVVDGVFRLTREHFSQFRVLGCDANGAGVQVALAEHDAAQRYQRRRCHAELFRTQQAGDGDVPPGLQLAIGLNDDAAAQVVQHKHLLCLGQP